MSQSTHSIAFSLMLLGACVFLTSEEVRAASSENPEIGQQTYVKACAKCHEGGFGRFFTNAPKTGKRPVWKPLLEKGVDALMLSTLEGLGKMEPRGGCTDCSDQQIQSALEYMLDQGR